MIILKVTKNQDFTLSLEDTFFKKPQGGRRVQIDSPLPNRFRVKEDLLCDFSNTNDPVERAIQKYKNHLSIQMIKETFDNDKTFSFDSMYQPKLLKLMLVCFQFLYPILLINLSFLAYFLSILKSADFTPVHKTSQSLKNLTMDQ